MIRRFVLPPKKKTWEIETRGAEQLIRKNGSQGMHNYSSSYKLHKSATACEADSEKKVAKQLQAGFSEVEVPQYPTFAITLYSAGSNDVFRVRDAAEQGFELSGPVLRKLASGGSADVVLDAASRGVELPTGLLASAALTGQSKLVERLLQDGVSPDEPNRSGSTALMLASQKSKAKVMRMLIQAGANLEAKESSGATALWHGLLSGKPQTVQLLLDAGADPHAAKEDKTTLLDRAVSLLPKAPGPKRERAVEVIQLFVGLGVQGNKKTLAALSFEGLNGS